MVTSPTSSRRLPTVQLWDPPNSSRLLIFSSPDILAGSETKKVLDCWHDLIPHEYQQHFPPSVTSVFQSHVLCPLLAHSGWPDICQKFYWKYLIFKWSLSRREFLESVLIGFKKDRVKKKSLYCKSFHFNFDSFESWEMK